MGAPKQKWTAEEEAALKAGVLKHGAGKWRSILKDPEFSDVLTLRSNVDLKDKWRNMSVMTNGSGSREKARLTVSRIHQAHKHDEHHLNLETATQSDEDFADPAFLATSSESPQRRNILKRSIKRSDTLIMETINRLKEPGGSKKATIAAYIEEEYWAPPNFKRLLSAKLKYMTSRGKLMKINRKYRIAPTSAALSDKGRRLRLPFLEGRFKTRQKTLRRVLEPEDFNAITKSQIDFELSKMKDMNPQEAAAAAAQAVAEAEAAIMEAEEAGREADAAEADAEVAQAFVDAASNTFNGKNNPRLMVRA